MTLRSADAASDFDVSGSVDPAGYRDNDQCADFGDDGKTGGTTGGWDHIIINGAVSTAGAVDEGLFCGQNVGLQGEPSTIATDKSTICCKFPSGFRS